jgi:preprotein translocase subunit SecG
MAWIDTLLNVLQVLSALAIIVLVLLQQGKGADMGAAFGSGSAGSVFGATGSANFLSRLTAAMAVLFFSSTLALSFLASQDITRSGSSGGIMESIPGAAQQPGGDPSIPAQPSTVPVPSGPSGAIPKQ